MKLVNLIEGVSSWAELEARIADLPSEKDRGEVFEEFCKAFLLLNPIFQFDRVYRQNEIPSSSRGHLGYPGIQDIGIDGLGVTTDGNLFAYQAKFRKDRNKIPSLRELSTFFTVSDRADWRITITNANNLPASINERTRHSRVLADRLDQLDPHFFIRLIHYLKDQTIPLPEKKAPHRTQEEAINAALSYFRENVRGQLILPCGTGKTLASMWIAERLGCKCILVMVPSLALVSQTLREWAANSSINPFRYLCLCSDTTVDLGNDSPVEHLYEMDIPVTTEVEAVSDFLVYESSTNFILFSTYQSSKVLSEAVKKTGTTFDIGIFDEAHRTTGTNVGVWNIALRDKEVPIKRRIFMTATPRIYAPRITKKARENDLLIYSMDDPSIYGKSFYEITFGEAIERGHITDYKVVVICVTDSEVKEVIEQGRKVVIGDGHEWDAKALAKRIALIKGIKAYRLKKIFTFHGRVQGAKAFTDTTTPYGIHQIFKMVESENSGQREISFSHVNGTMSSGVRNALMKEFRESEIGIMSNARCLVEGVDVPTVDTVAFIDPKRSLIDIVQATGRALRKAEWKEKGYIFIPVIVEEDTEPEKLIGSSNFDTVWKVLEAMVDQDQRLEDIVAKLRIMQGNGEQDTKLWNDAMREFSERVEFFNLPIRVDRTRFISQISPLVIEGISRNWYFMFGLLEKYRKEQPDTWPSREKYLGYNLGSWCHMQRSAKKKGILLKKRFELLESIGFPWSPFESDLWSSSELAERLGIHVSVIIDWTKKGKIVPSKVYRSGKFVYYFFQPGYDKEVKKIFDVTLDSTEGLLSVNEVAELFKVQASTISGLVRRNLVKPEGRAFISGGTGVSMFFSQGSLEKTRKKLGITIVDKSGLMSPAEMAKVLGIDKHAIYGWVKKGIINPIGKGFQSGGKGIGDFFHPDQIQKIRNVFGITLESTDGLLTNKQLATALGLQTYQTINKWLGQKKVSAHGYGFGGSTHTVRAYFHPNQIEEIKKSFGVTLSGTKGLIALQDVARKLGVQPALIHTWLKRGLIREEGKYWSPRGAGIEYFFKPESIKEIRKKFGVTLQNPKGFLSSTEFASNLGVDQTTLKKWVKKGLISAEVAFLPATKKYVGYYFRKRQIEEIRRLFGVTLVKTTGLLSQEEFAEKLGVKPVTVWSWIKRRRRLKPFGYKFAPGGKGIRAYFHPSQLKEIKHSDHIKLEKKKS